VQLTRDNSWIADPRRVWAAKRADAGEGEPSASPLAGHSSGKIRIERTPVGERTLTDLQAHLLLEPMWLASPVGSWVILPQPASRRLVFKQWQEERPTYRERTLAEIIARLRAQAWPKRLLNPDSEAPLRSWFITTAAIGSHSC
jgi:hypothetical protein